MTPDNGAPALHPTHHPTHQATRGGGDGMAGDMTLATGLATATTQLALKGDAKIRKVKRAEPKVVVAPAKPNALMRWSPSVRVETCATEVMSRLWFGGGALWSVNPGAAPPQNGKREVELTELIEMTAPADGPAIDFQIDETARAASTRPDRMAEILSQMDDLWPYWTSITGIDPAQAPRTAEVVAVAQLVGERVVMQFKNHLAVRRPVQRSALVGPMIDTPGHGSLPSGHAMQAFMVAAVLSRLLGLDPKKEDPPLTSRLLRRLARRIAHNRVVAGVHFPMDSLAGCLLGDVLGEFLAGLGAQENFAYCGSNFNGGAVKTEEDSRAQLQLETLDVDTPSGLKGSAAEVGADRFVPTGGGLFRSLWDAASAELALQQPFA